MARLPVPLTLKDKDRHDRKSIIRLNEQVFRQQQLLGTFEEGIRILDIRFVIARCSFPILDGERVVAAVPFQTLEAEPEGNTAGGGDDSAGLGKTTLCVRIVKPKSKAANGRLHIVESDVDAALCIVAVLRNDVRSRGGQKRHCQLANSYMQVLETRSVAAHVQRIKVVNLNVLAPVISFTGPELRIRLALEDVAALDKSFPQTKLIVSDAAWKICVTGGIRGIGLQHHLRPHPCFVVVVFGVHPVVYEDKLSVGFCFIAQSIFRVRSRSLEGDLLPTIAIEAIPRTKVAVELETLHLLLQLLNLGVRLAKQVIGRF